ncbi:MAG: AsmA-like C-terminal domain-containing protein [Desulfobacterales bacterium]
MHIFKNILLWASGITGILLLTVLVLVLVLPMILRIDAAKEKFIAELSQRSGVELTFEQTNLSFSPRPTIVVHKVGLEIPGKGRGTIETLNIRLGINPFAGWKAGIAGFRMERPDVTVHLPAPSERDEQAPFSFPDIDKTIRAALASLMPKAKGLVVEIDRGELHLFSGGTLLLELRDIHGRAKERKNTLSAEMTGVSTLEEKLSFEATVDRDNLEGSGRIDLVDIKPHGLMKTLMPAATFRFGASGMNLSTEFKIDDKDGLSIDYRSRLPSLTIDHRQNTAVFKGVKLSGSAHIHRGKAVVSIGELSFDYPPLALTGNLRVGRASPEIRLELEGREIDINALRKEVVAIAGDNAALAKIFAIVKGGRIPHLSLKTHGNSVTDLGRPENLALAGSMVQGEIFIKQANLDLTDVKGDAAIIGGVLKGDALSASVGDTRGTEGTLNLGLLGPNAPFHLDIMVDANLAQLPPILRTFIKNPSFVRELDLVTSLTGRARGILILGETTSHIRTRVTVNDFQLSAEYDRMPSAMHLRGRHFSYSAKTISLKDVSGHIGNSSLSEITGWIDWSNSPNLNISSGNGRIHLDEIYPWLTSMDLTPLKTDRISQVNGTIVVTDVKVAGPVTTPVDLQYDVSGHFNDVKIHHDAISAPLHVTEGSFHATEDTTAHTLALDKLRGSILNNTLGLSGNLKGWRDSEGTDISFQGSLATESNPEKSIRLRGDLKLLPGNLSLDVDMEAEALNWDDLRKDMAAIVSGDPAEPTGRYWDLPVKGTVRLKSASFAFGSATWQPFGADITLSPGKIDVSILDADLCGIPTPGQLRISPGEMSLDLKLDARQLPLAPTLSCLFNKQNAITGQFNLTGELSGQGKPEDISRAIRGSVDFTARDGRIHNDSVIAKVFAVLNITEGLWGKLPEIGKQGIGYRSMTIKGQLEEGKLNITESIVDGEAMEIVGKGTIDITNQELDIVLLVAPLKTVDRVVRNIPIVGYILGGSLVSVPVSVRGNIEDPQITTLRPSEIGAGMVRMLERIFKTPVHILQSIPTSNGKARTDSEETEQRDPMPVDRSDFRAPDYESVQDPD